GGQRQRIALARAFLKDSPVLILDEPTSAVDAETEAKILGAMRHLMRGRTVVLISHRPSTLERCEGLLVLDHGRVVTDTSRPITLAPPPAPPAPPPRRASARPQPTGARPSRAIPRCARGVSCTPTRRRRRLRRCGRVGGRAPCTASSAPVEAGRRSSPNGAGRRWRRSSAPCTKAS